MVKNWVVLDLQILTTKKVLSVPHQEHTISILIQKKRIYQLHIVNHLKTLNIDLNSLSNEAQGKFFGHVC